jgi:hypothetical protein
MSSKQQKKKKKSLGSCFKPIKYSLLKENNKQKTSLKKKSSFKGEYFDVDSSQEVFATLQTIKSFGEGQHRSLPDMKSFIYTLTSKERLARAQHYFGGRGSLYPNELISLI